MFDKDLTVEEIRSIEEKDRTRVENATLTWSKVFLLLGGDLPDLADKINRMSEEADMLF